MSDERRFLPAGILDENAFGRSPRPARQAEDVLKIRLTRGLTKSTIAASCTSSLPRVNAKSQSMSCPAADDSAPLLTGVVMCSSTRIAKVGYLLGLSVAVFLLLQPATSEGQVFRGSAPFPNPPIPGIRSVPGHPGMPPPPLIPALNNLVTDSTAGFLGTGMSMSGGGFGGSGFGGGLVAGTAEMAVGGTARLVSGGLAHRAIHV
jgi:hypothetical protein